MGLAWFFRRRRAQPAAVPAPASDPAEELKQKLAESRAEEAAPAPEAPSGVDDRRREVHERARASIEQMRGQPPEG
jgi:hypothetical protein